MFSRPEDAAHMDEVVAMIDEDRRRPSQRPINFEL